jgi:hypothetical protein
MLPAARIIQYCNVEELYKKLYQILSSQQDSTVQLIFV